MRQVAFLLVGTLVLWYLGHFGLNAVLMVVAPDLPAAWSRGLDLLLVPLAALVTWLAMRRLEPGDVRPDMRRAGPPATPGEEPSRGEAAEPNRPETGRSDAT